MSFISQIRKLYKNLRDGLKWAHHGCRVTQHIVAEISNSNASDALKAQAVAVETAMSALCAAIEAYIASLPGNTPEE